MHPRVHSYGIHHLPDQEYAKAADRTLGEASP